MKRLAGAGARKPRLLHAKIKSLRALAAALGRLRAQSGRAGSRSRVVFTNGCFDLLHPGHVRYLEAARRLGEVLVVALNADASVRRLKGKGRPLNPLGDRLEVMAALEAVDFVTWFEEDVPRSAILALRPDVLVKGGDWPVEKIVGGREVLSWGGRVRSLPFIAGRSTTKIIARAQARRK